MLGNSALLCLPMRRAANGLDSLLMHQACPGLVAPVVEKLLIELHQWLEQATSMIPGQRQVPVQTAWLPE